jgi:hypothetical protein
MTNFKVVVELTVKYLFVHLFFAGASKNNSASVLQLYSCRFLDMVRDLRMTTQAVSIALGDIFRINPAAFVKSA